MNPQRTAFLPLRYVEQQPRHTGASARCRQCGKVFIMPLDACGRSTPACPSCAAALDKNVLRSH